MVIQIISGLILIIFIFIFIRFFLYISKVTALIEASEKGQEDKVKLLLDKGANVNGQYQVRGMALMYASGKGHVNIVKLLLDKGAKVNAKDYNRRTALMLASYAGQREVVKILLNNGVDIYAKDKNGQTAIEYAEAIGGGIVHLLKTYNKESTSNDFVIKYGNYYLTQNINEIKKDLREISKEIFNLGSIKKNFSDEKIYGSKTIIFLDNEWDIMLGVIKDKVYKIALHLASSQVANPIGLASFNGNHEVVKIQENPIFSEIQQYFKSNYGKVNEVKEVENSNLYIWDTKYGNIILEIGKKINKDSYFNILNIFDTYRQPFKESSQEGTISN